MERKRFVVGLGVAVSILFLWLALREQKWDRVLEAFQQANYIWLLPACLLILTDYLFRAWRWGFILRPVTGRQLPLGTLFPVLLLGFAANNVFPARAGELWRVWGLSHHTELRKTVALSTLVVERVFDGFTLLFLMAIAGLLHPLSGEAKLIEYGLTFLFVLVLLVLLLILYFEEWTLRVATRLMWPVPATLRERVLAMIGRFAEGLHVLRRPKPLLAVIGTSLLAWSSQALSFAAILLAFDLNLSVTGLLATSVLMLAFINLFIMIPAAPGNLGTFEAAGIASLTVAGIASAVPEVATAIVLVTHMLQWLLVTGLGLPIGLREGLTVARLTPELEAD